MPRVLGRILLLIVAGVMMDTGSVWSQEPATSEASEQAPSLSEPLSDDEKKTELDEFVPPSEVAKKAFEEPPEARRLSDRNVWIDRKQQRVYADGYVAMTDGALEMFACPSGTKEHESLVATIAKSSELHTALLAIGAKSGTPVSYDPTFVPATGQRIRIWICYYDEQDKFHAVDARSWVQAIDTKKELKTDWVFAGSNFWKDPDSGKEYYQANAGDMICVSNFGTAMLDLPVSSSAQADDLLYGPFTNRLPERGTPVRLVMVPIAIPSDKPSTKPKADSKTPPKKEVLTRKKSA